MAGWAWGGNSRMPAHKSNGEDCMMWLAPCLKRIWVVVQRSRRYCETCSLVTEPCGLQTLPKRHSPAGLVTTLHDYVHRAGDLKETEICRMFEQLVLRCLQAWVITLARAGEDNASFRLVDVDSTLAGFAGADYDLQVGWSASMGRWWEGGWEWWGCLHGRAHGW